MPNAVRHLSHGPVSHSRVGVVVPAYNAETWIGECVESVLAQTVADLQLVVVDDGSTDGTLEALGRFQDRRLTILTQENRGVAAARNRGAGATEARYLAFLDADDLYEPLNLERKVDFLEEHERAVLVHSHRIDFDENGVLSIHDESRCAGEALEQILSFTATVNAPSSAVLRRTTFIEVGGFDEELSTSADRDLWIRLALEGLFGYLPDPLIRYRRHEDQMHRNIRAMEHDLRRISNKLQADDRVPGALRHTFATQMSRVLAGSYWHDAGEPIPALRCGAEYLVQSLRSLVIQ